MVKFGRKFRPSRDMHGRQWGEQLLKALAKFSQTTGTGAEKGQTAKVLIDTEVRRRQEKDGVRAEDDAGVTERDVANAMFNWKRTYSKKE